MPGFYIGDDSYPLLYGPADSENQASDVGGFRRQRQDCERGGQTQFAA